MKKKVIDILINQLEKYCNLLGTKCRHCPCFIYNPFCLFGALDAYKNKSTELIKYLYSLDEGLEFYR